MAIRGVPRERDGDFGSAVGRQRDAEQCGAAAEHLLELGLVVEVQVADEAEPVVHRAGQQTGPGGGADQGERRDVERDRGGARALAEHDVDAEVLHRGVQQLLRGPGDAVDLVDEQHLARPRRGQDRDEVAGALDRRARR